MPKSPLWTKAQMDFLREWMATAPAASAFTTADLDHLATLGPPRSKAAVEAKAKSLKIVDALRHERPAKACTRPAKAPKPAKACTRPAQAPSADLGLLLAIMGVDPETLEAALGRAWVSGWIPDGVTRADGLRVVSAAQEAHKELWA